jgi:ABC-type phosphate/phosphonate transport system substrate-binding protein
MSLASLPMYDLPELRAETDGFWRALAGHLRRAGIAAPPQALSRPVQLPEHWLAPDLLFSQTCGYPLRHALKGRVRLIATPCYGAPGCQGPSYRSLIMVRTDSRLGALGDLRGARAAFNGTDSQSGYNALRFVIAPLAKAGRFFAEVVETGSHAASLEAVAAGKADVCAVDCVSYALFARHRRPALEELRELCRTPPTPGLPYVTAGDASLDQLTRLRAGLAAAYADPSLAELREALMLRGIEELDESAYEALDRMEAAAVSQGYPILS